MAALRLRQLRALSPDLRLRLRDVLLDVVHLPQIVAGLGVLLRQWKTKKRGKGCCAWGGQAVVVSELHRKSGSRLGWAGKTTHHPTLPRGPCPHPTPPLPSHPPTPPTSSCCRRMCFSASSFCSFFSFFSANFKR